MLQIKKKKTTLKCNIKWVVDVESASFKKAQVTGDFRSSQRHQRRQQVGLRAPLASLLISEGATLQH